MANGITYAHLTPADCQYAFDDAPDALHVGAFCNGAVVGVGTITCEDLVPSSSGTTGLAWRIRGMAVDAEFRGCSVGRQLVGAMVQHAAAQGGKWVWCNARTTACGFYRRCGFQAQGEEFTIEGIGPHFVMVRLLRGG